MPPAKRACSKDHVRHQRQRLTSGTGSGRRRRGRTAPMAREVKRLAASAKDVAPTKRYRAPLQLLAGGAGMPKTPQLNGYQISVDRVIKPGQVTADRKIAVLVTAGSARLQLELEPPAALRLADGIMAALRKMTGLPVFK